MPAIQGELSVRDLHVSVGGKEILKGINMTVRAGETVAVMGPNGSGKSTLAYALAGHPRYTVTSGEVTMDGKNLITMTPDARARAGLFLGFQYPVEVSGVSLSKFLWTSYTQKHASEEIDIEAYQARVDKYLADLGIGSEFLKRSLNEGFSGGEKKRSEVLQMATLEPKFAILDEPDSGLDIDAVKVVGEAIRALRRPEVGLVVVTHYQRILKYINPDRVYVIVDGVIAKEGGRDLAEELELRGYDWVKIKSSA
jgi:Fe-S cluster assembly ATP-binding protein